MSAITLYECEKCDTLSSSSGVCIECEEKLTPVEYVPAAELADLRAEVVRIKELAKKARNSLSATQRNWDEECLFDCNDILKLIIGICPACTWRGDVELNDGVCPQCGVDWHELPFADSSPSASAPLTDAEKEFKL